MASSRRASNDGTKVNEYAKPIITIETQLFLRLGIKSRKNGGPKQNSPVALNSRPQLIKIYLSIFSEMMPTRGDNSAKAAFIRKKAKAT